MAEAIALDYSQLEGCGNVYEAASQRATQQSVPTWNGWTSLVAQLRRPPRAYAAGVRPGGPRGQPVASHRSAREVPIDAPIAVQAAAVLGEEARC